MLKLVAMDNKGYHIKDLTDGSIEIIDKNLFNSISSAIEIDRGMLDKKLLAKEKLLTGAQISKEEWCNGKTYMTLRGVPNVSGTDYIVPDGVEILTKEFYESLEKNGVYNIKIPESVICSA